MPRRAAIVLAPAWLLLAAVSAEPGGLPPAKAAAPADAGGPARSEAADPVPWRALEFGASDWWNSVSLTARRSPVAAGGGDLIPIPDRAALEPGRAETELLEVTVEARIRGIGSPKRWSGEIWYLRDGTPLQRVRSKLGSRATRKLYRYAADGVYRVREESSERRASFHPLPGAASGCSSVSDPGLLLLLASSLDLSPGSTRRVCVFNKKGVYEVELRSGARQARRVEFQQSGPSGASGPGAAEEAIRIEIAPRALDDAAALEDFEFFELRSPLAISVDPRSRLPVVIEGAIAGAGVHRFELIRAEAAPRR